jgi:DNA-binding GntR family transcriptional regulator
VSGGRLGLTIARTSTHDQVVGALREAILLGTVPPGTPLREIPLAAEMGVSRNTVREALRVLAAEGLVRYELNRGAIVAQLSDRDIDELYQARFVLEAAGVTALLGGGAAAAAALGRLAALVDRIESAFAAGDVVGVLAGDREFHDTLVAATGNARLCRAHAALQRELRLALSLAERSTQALGRPTDDHRTLLEALTRGPVRAAQSALRTHLDRGAEELHRLRALVHP